MCGSSLRAICVNFSLAQNVASHSPKGGSESEGQSQGQSEGKPEGEVVAASTSTCANALGRQETVAGGTCRSSAPGKVAAANECCQREEKEARERRCQQDEEEPVRQIAKRRAAIPEETTPLGHPYHGVIAFAACGAYKTAFQGRRRQAAADPREASAVDISGSTLVSSLGGGASYGGDARAANSFSDLGSIVILDTEDQNSTPCGNGSGGGPGQDAKADCPVFAAGDAAARSIVILDTDGSSLAGGGGHTPTWWSEDDIPPVPARNLTPCGNGSGGGPGQFNAEAHSSVFEDGVRNADRPQHSLPAEFDAIDPGGSRLALGECSTEAAGIGPKLDWYGALVEEPLPEKPRDQPRARRKTRNRRKAQQSTDAKGSAPGSTGATQQAVALASDKVSKDCLNGVARAAKPKGGAKKFVVAGCDLQCHAPAKDAVHEGVVPVPTPALEPKTPPTTPRKSPEHFNLTPRSTPTTRCSDSVSVLCDVPEVPPWPWPKTQHEPSHFESLVNMFSNAPAAHRKALFDHFASNCLPEVAPQITAAFRHACDEA